MPKGKGTTVAEENAGTKRTSSRKVHEQTGLTDEELKRASGNDSDGIFLFEDGNGVPVEDAPGDEEPGYAPPPLPPERPATPGPERPPHLPSARIPTSFRRSPPLKVPEPFVHLIHRMDGDVRHLNNKERHALQLTFRNSDDAADAMLRECDSLMSSGYSRDDAFRLLDSFSIHQDTLTIYRTHANHDLFNRFVRKLKEEQRLSRDETAKLSAPARVRLQIVNWDRSQGFGHPDLRLGFSPSLEEHYPLFERTQHYFERTDGTRIPNNVLPHEYRKPPKKAFSSTDVIALQYDNGWQALTRFRDVTCCEQDNSLADYFEVHHGTLFIHGTPEDSRFAALTADVTKFIRGFSHVQTHSESFQYRNGKPVAVILQSREKKPKGEEPAQAELVIKRVTEPAQPRESTLSAALASQPAANGTNNIFANITPGLAIVSSFPPKTSDGQYTFVLQYRDKGLAENAKVRTAEALKSRGLPQHAAYVRQIQVSDNSELFFSLSTDSPLVEQLLETLQTCGVAMRCFQPVRSFSTSESKSR